MATDKDNAQADQYWKSRILCSDESCIGVIGPDGRCKECGKTFEGELSPGWVPDEDVAPSDDTNTDETPPEESVAASAEPAEPQPAAVAADVDWESRKLCSDESCIGVIGPDGRCKECGKPFKA